MQGAIRNDGGCSDDLVASWRMTVSNITVINKNHTGVYFVQCSQWFTYDQCAQTVPRK